MGRKEVVAAPSEADDNGDVRFLLLRAGGSFAARSLLLRKRRLVDARGVKNSRGICIAAVGAFRMRDELMMLIRMVYSTVIALELMNVLGIIMRRSTF